MGVPHDNVIMCDSKGVIYQGRIEGMDQWKSAHAAKTTARSLAEAIVGADVFLGLSRANILTADMMKTMADQPIIFAMANPDPEISPPVARAAVQFKQDGYGVPVLIGRDARVTEKLIGLGANPDDYEIHNSAQSPLVDKMVDRLYNRLQRRGYLRRDIHRMVNRDRNIFGALLLQMDQADAMITGVTRTFGQTLSELRRVLDPKKDAVPFGIHVMVGKTHTVFIADTTVNERPTAEELAHIAEKTAAVARRMGHMPRVAFLSFSTFGNPAGTWLNNIRDAVALLDTRRPDFEYEGDMPPDVALNAAVMKNYPFCRLSGPANVLVMPGLQSANLSAKLLRELGGDQVIGPMLLGMERQVQVATMASSTSDLVTLAVLAAAGVTE